MPDITKEENGLLLMLTSSNVLTLGKGRMKEVAAFCHRLMYLADQAAQGERTAKVMSNGFWLVASGKLTEAELCERPDLTDQQRDDLLTMLQLRLYAEEYCIENYISLEGLPEVEQSAPVQGPKTKEQLEMETLTMQALMVGEAGDGKFHHEENRPVTRGLSTTNVAPLGSNFDFDTPGEVRIMVGQNKDNFVRVILTGDADALPMQKKYDALRPFVNQLQRELESQALPIPYPRSDD